MKNMTPSTNKTYLPTLTGLIISLVFSGCIIFSLFGYGSFYDIKIILISLCIVVFWLVGFIFNARKAKINLKDFLISIVLLSVLSVYLVNVVWNSNTLNLDVFTNIYLGGVHVDTMFHTTLARTIFEVGAPSILADGIHGINYHTGSHLILAIISFVFIINIVFVYNYIYPVVFIPLFFYLLQQLIVNIKFYMGKNTIVKNIDLLFVMMAFIPLLSYASYHNAGIFLNNYFVSESFLIANALMLLFINLFVLLYRKSYFNHKIIGTLWYTIAIPAFIVLISFAKISTGAIVLSGVMYIIFRKNMRNIKHWILNAWYAASFFIYYFGSYSVSSGGSYGGDPFFKILAFEYYYIENGNSLFYLLFFSIFSLSVALYATRKINGLKQIVFTDKFFLEEALIVMTVTSFLPGMFFHFYGGSAGYFFMVPTIVGLAFFVANELPYKIYDKLCGTFLLKKAVKILFVCIVVTFVVNINLIDLVVNMNNQMKHTEKYSEENYTTYKNQIMSGDIFSGIGGIVETHLAPNKYMNGTFVQELIRLDSLPAEQKRESVIFIDSDSVIWDNYNDGDALLFTISGYTGIESYNMLVYNEDDLPAYHNKERSIRYGMGYGLNRINVHENELTIEEVKTNVKDDGYNYIYYFTGDTLEEIIL